MSHASTTSPQTLAEFPSFEFAVLDGFANEVAGNVRGRVPYWYEYDPSVPIPEGVVPITLGAYPANRPEGSITLAEYTVMDDVSLSDSVVGVSVQIWMPTRREVATVVSDLFDLFHGRISGTLGTVTLVMAERSTGANVGQDSNQRQGRSENYYLTVHRPSTNRT